MNRQRVWLTSTRPEVITYVCTSRAQRPTSSLSSAAKLKLWLHHASVTSELKRRRVWRLDRQSQDSRCVCQQHTSCPVACSLLNAGCIEDQLSRTQCQQDRRMEQFGSVFDRWGRREFSQAEREEILGASEWQLRRYIDVCRVEGLRDGRLGQVSGNTIEFQCG